jgi:predicted esterase
MDKAVQSIRGEETSTPPRAGRTRATFVEIRPPAGGKGSAISTAPLWATKGDNDVADAAGENAAHPESKEAAVTVKRSDNAVVVSLRETSIGEGWTIIEVAKVCVMILLLWGFLDVTSEFNSSTTPRISQVFLLFATCYVSTDLLASTSNIYLVSESRTFFMASAVIVTRCHRCGAGPSPTRRIRACTGCSSVGYCSKSCQRADWSGRDGHKSVCRAERIYRAADPTDAAARLEVKRDDADEWEDVGPINFVEDTMIAKMLDSAQGGGRQRTIPPRVGAHKELPIRTRRILGDESSEKYKYRHSHDGVDENLFILFHGAGDSHLPFDALGLQMALPQTATLSISASISLGSTNESNPDLGRFVELPFGFGHTWFEEMDYECTGETLPMDHPRRLNSLSRALEMLCPLLCSLMDQSTPEAAWIPERVFLSGFSAGACLVMEMCRMWMDDGRMPLGGAICIAGGIRTGVSRKVIHRSAVAAQQKQPSEILIITGEDDLIYPAGAAELSKELYHPNKVQVHVQKGKGHSMIGSEDEMRVMMEFLSKRLVRRSVWRDQQAKF